jgi:hypothetical protein
LHAAAVTSGLSGYEFSSAKLVCRNVVFSDPAAGNPKSVGFTEFDFLWVGNVGEEFNKRVCFPVQTVE